MGVESIFVQTVPSPADQQQHKNSSLYSLSIKHGQPPSHDNIKDQGLIFEYYSFKKEIFYFTGLTEIKVIMPSIKLQKNMFHHDLQELTR